MAENKTRKTDQSVDEFIAGIKDERKRSDAEGLLQLMGEVTGESPRMWGPSIIGFGDVHYKYESGREGDWFQVGFSPRKANLALYLQSGLDGHAHLLARLGKHSTGKGCLYINRLEDIDRDVLVDLLNASIATTG